MPVYTYRGTNRAGSNVTGEMTATNKGELQNLLKRQQISATKMSEKGREINLTFAGVKSAGAGKFHQKFSVMMTPAYCWCSAWKFLGRTENKTFQKYSNTRRRSKAVPHSAAMSSRKGLIRYTPTWRKQARPAVFLIPFAKTSPTSKERKAAP
jgi:type II secretory pathway component PulF